MTKRSVSLGIHSPLHPGAVLLVQRPDDDEELPGAWGLPAASLTDAEDWVDAARRAGRQKLGVELRIHDLLQQGSLERAAYTLEMRLYAASIAAGEPVLTREATGVTLYQAWRWGSPEELRPAAQRGSLCCALYLRTQTG
ncbi:NUDIX domain-containing protein [soil metagenome]